MNYPPHERLDLAVATSCHNYGRWLRDWALSIVALRKYWPVRVAIVDNGSTDTTPHQVAEAVRILEQAEIEVKTERIPYTNFGAARNRAVELSGPSEWVMHLDADDMLMEEAFEDFAELMPEADVVGAGYRRCGDLKSGPRNVTRTYSRHRGQQTLNAAAPCSGVSPFRRRLWEESPYRTDMRGGWDTALWIGFAHLDARFVPTRRPVFWYRQHAGSIFNTRWPNACRTHFVGVKLGNLRRKISEGVAVIIPWKPDGAERDLAFDWVRRRYAELHPEWEVVAGSVPEGQPWRKGAAIADGLSKTKAATMVMADADVFVAPEALREAVDAIQNQRAEWVVPHRYVKRLSKEATEAALACSATLKPEGEPRLAREAYEGYAGGGVFVIDRSDYEAAGGIPGAFVGWGAEDECMAVILDTLLGPHERYDYDLWHLWHSPARRMRHVQYTTNKRIYRLYLDRFGDRDLMWQLVDHVRGGGDPERVPGRGIERPIGMVAIQRFQRGREIIEPGELFHVSEEEARRLELRARKIARRANGRTLAAPGRTSRERTLDIRAEQAERNAVARDRLERRRELLRKRR